MYSLWFWIFRAQKQVHQDAHLAIHLNYSFGILCLGYNLIAKDPWKNLHEQAPVHKSWRLMSELMANPNGHLQVINVIHGCQLTSHLNNCSLWNTNQTASPWYSNYFSPSVWGIIRGQRQWGGIVPLASLCRKKSRTNTHYTPYQTHGYASILDNEKLVFLSPWQVCSCCFDVQTRAQGSAQMNVGELMLHLNQI